MKEEDDDNKLIITVIKNTNPFFFFLAHFMKKIQYHKKTYQINFIQKLLIISFFNRNPRKLNNQ